MHPGHHVFRRDRLSEPYIFGDELHHQMPTHHHHHHHDQKSTKELKLMAVAPPAAPFLNGNANIALVDVGGQLAGIDQAAADRRLERRLRFHAVVYMMLGASFIVSAVVPHAGARHTVASGRSGAFEAGIGALLWAAAVALTLLSFHLRRFPATALAAARLAQAALRAFF